MSSEKAASATAGLCTFSGPGEMSKKDNAVLRAGLKSSLVAPELKGCRECKTTCPGALQTHTPYVRETQTGTLVSSRR